MAYRDVPLLRRYVLLDLAERLSIRINRNDAVILNAGRYQIDTAEGVENLEVDERVSVQSSPVGMGFLTSLDGLPVSGPLTLEEIKNSHLVRKEMTLARDHVGLVGQYTAIEDIYLEALVIMADNGSGITEVKIGYYGGPASHVVMKVDARNEAVTKRQEMGWVLKKGWSIVLDPEFDEGAELQVIYRKM